MSLGQTLQEHDILYCTICIILQMIIIQVRPALRNVLSRNDRTGSLVSAFQNM